MGLQLARPLPLNAWVSASRVRNKIARWRGQPLFWDDVRDWLDENARGRTLVDVGGMWGDHWAAFDAAERGASVTMLDVTPPTDQCLAEQERRGVEVRYVCGDLHDPDVLGEVDVQDIVMCSGVLYHCPSPLLTLERLRSITGGHLLLAGQVLQEVPGLPQACVFYPGLKEEERKAFAAPIGGVADGLTTPFDAKLDYSNWWWGITRSALRGMLSATGWTVLDEHAYNSPPGYRSFVIAEPDANATPATTPMARQTATA